MGHNSWRSVKAMTRELLLCDTQICLLLDTAHAALVSTSAYAAHSQPSRHTTMGRVATTSCPSAAARPPSAPASTCVDPPRCHLLPLANTHSTQLPAAANGHAARFCDFTCCYDAACVVPVLGGQSVVAAAAPSSHCATHDASRRRLVRTTSPCPFMHMLASSACLIPHAHRLFLANIIVLHFCCTTNQFLSFSPLLSDPPAPST